MASKRSTIWMSICFLIFMVACANAAEDEMDQLVQTLQKDNAPDALVALIEAVYEEKSIENELKEATIEANETISTLEQMEFQSNEAIEMKDAYISSIEDFQEIIKIVSENEEHMTEDVWAEIEKISKHANEKQMKIVQAKYEQLDIDLSNEVEE